MKILIWRKIGRLINRATGNKWLDESRTEFAQKVRHNPEAIRYFVRGIWVGWRSYLKKDITFQLSVRYKEENYILEIVFKKNLDYSTCYVIKGRGL